MDKSSHPISILTYHSIDESGSVLSIAPKTFRQQMAFLADNGFTVLALSEAVRRIKQGQPFPAKTVALTFDDGLESVYREAWPVLKDYNFPATVFVISGYCGKLNDWPGQPAIAPRFQLLEWDKLGALAERGFEIGGHSVKHPDLTRLNSAQVEAEMLESKAQIKAKLGVEASLFAYPYGAFDNTTQEICERYFEGAVTTRLQEASLKSEPYRLERLDMFYLQDLRLFRQLGTPWLRTYLGGRRVLRDLKKFSTRPVHLAQPV